MNLLVPTALAFGAIIPIILLLYFMRPKRQERVIGSTLLWQQALQDIQASRPWQRLRITPLLLLQLLAALVIVFILARPAIFSNSAISGNTIIILQASASMQATDVAPNRFESAKNTINDFIDSMGSNDHISLISMAHTPRVLLNQSQDRARLHSALQSAQVTNQDADLQQALSLASSLAAGQVNPQVLVIGDGHIINTDQPLITSFPVRYMPIGTDAPNVALLALASRTLQGKLTAFAQVANYSPARRSIPVELSADGKLIGVQTITLAPNTSGSIEWSPLVAGTQTLHARLLTQDAMTVDHEAWAVVGSSIHARVLLVTDGNVYLESYLRLQPNIDLFKTTPDKYSSASTYDLTLFDNFVPAKLPTGNIFFVNPKDGNYDFGTSGSQTGVTHLSPGTDTIKLLSDVDLSTIHVIHTSHKLQPSLWMEPIITAPETPLMLAGEHDNKRVAVLGFDIHVSDLPLQPAFPIMMHNLTSWLLPPPIPDNAQVTPGLPLTIQSWPGAEHVTITGPDRQITTIGPPFPVNPYAQTNAVGIYQVTQTVHGHTLAGQFAINLFNPTQSHLLPARALPILHSSNLAASGNTVPRQLREIWPWIAAFLLLVLCAEWWLFSRGHKTQPARSQRPGTARLANGHILQRTPTHNTFVANVQQQLQQRYTLTKKRVLKANKRLRGKLKQRTKGEKRVNI